MIYTNTLSYPLMQEKTREKILNSALKLFSEKGFLGATTKEIAKKAGISEVTLFRYFPSKEKLFEEVINRYSFLPKLKEVLQEAEKLPYPESLKSIATSFLEVLEMKESLVRIMLSEKHRYPEKIKKIYKTIIENIFQLLSSYLSSLQKKGILREFDTKYTSMAFLGMFFSFFLWKGEKFNSSDQNAIIDIFTDLFINGTLNPQISGNKKHT
jgi:AcrR family transcriptional regulator